MDERKLAPGFKYFTASGGRIGVCSRDNPRVWRSVAEAPEEWFAPLPPPTPMRPGWKVGQYVKALTGELYRVAAVDLRVCRSGCGWIQRFEDAEGKVMEACHTCFAPLERAPAQPRFFRYGKALLRLDVATDRAWWLVETDGSLSKTEHRCGLTPPSEANGDVEITPAEAEWMLADARGPIDGPWQSKGTWDGQPKRLPRRGEMVVAEYGQVGSAVVAGCDYKGEKYYETRFILTPHPALRERVRVLWNDTMGDIKATKDEDITHITTFIEKEIARDADGS